MIGESGYRLIASFVWYNEGETVTFRGPHKYGWRVVLYVFWFLAVAHLSSAGGSDLWGIIPFVSQLACLHPFEPKPYQLHNNTLSTAAGALAGLAHVHLAVRGAGSEST